MPTFYSRTTGEEWSFEESEFRDVAGMSEDDGLGEMVHVEVDCGMLWAISAYRVFEPGDHQSLKIINAPRALREKYPDDYREGENAVVFLRAD
jgi:hypothetical protein